ncbi:MAG: hypothetical protein AAF351_01955 [Pseudomonadota bacterium]
MSKPAAVIPFEYRDINPDKERHGGIVNRTERNPEGKMQAQYVGTPVKTEQELKDDKIIRQNIETKMRGTSISQKISTLLDQRRDPALVEEFEKLYAQVTS